MYKLVLTSWTTCHWPKVWASLFFFHKFSSLYLHNIITHFHCSFNRINLSNFLHIIISKLSVNIESTFFWCVYVYNLFDYPSSRLAKNWKRNDVTDTVMLRRIFSTILWKKNGDFQKFLRKSETFKYHQICHWREYLKQFRWKHSG